MSTITAILEPSTDGSLHLPVPAGLRARQIRVTAVLEPLTASKGPLRPKFGCLGGKITLEKDFDEPLEDFRECME